MEDMSTWQMIVAALGAIGAVAAAWKIREKRRAEQASIAEAYERAKKKSDKDLVGDVTRRGS
jgi:hypothetical protein